MGVTQDVGRRQQALKLRLEATAKGPQAAGKLRRELDIARLNSHIPFFLDDALVGKSAESSRSRESIV